MATGQRVDPYGNFNFLVEIDGIARAAFHGRERVRLDDRRHRVPRGRREHDAAQAPRADQAREHHLKWGLTDDRELYDWHRERVQGNSSARTARSSLLDRARQREVARWNFVNAWPAKWDGPSLTAEGNDVAIETLELAHEGVERA